VNIDPPIVTVVGPVIVIDPWIKAEPGSGIDTVVGGPVTAVDDISVYAPFPKLRHSIVDDGWRIVTTLSEHRPIKVAWDILLSVVLNSLRGDCLKSKQISVM